MKGHLAFVGAVLALAVWIVACPANFNVTQCQTACRQLATCGFLPSSLGTPLTGVGTFDNCAGRCEESSDSVVNTIYGCAGTVDLGDDAAPPACGQGCASVAKCLTSNYPLDDVTGQAGITVVPVLAAGGEALEGGSLEQQGAGAVQCACPPDAGPCSQPGGFQFVGDLPSEWCRGEFGTTARAFLFQFGSYVFSGTTGCPDLLAHPPTFTSITPGPALVGVEVRGTVTIASDAGSEGDAPGDDGGQLDAAGPSPPMPFCHQYYGSHVALVAGQIETALVPLRGDASAPILDCEEGYVLCHDNIDNDLNGLLDCSDPRCAPFCLDAAAPLPDASPFAIEAGALLDAGLDAESD